MVSTSVINKIDRLESQVQALKHNPWQLERDINNLLKALNAEPATERDYLRERLFTITATALLTASVLKGFDTSPVGKFFSLEKAQPRTEQVQSDVQASANVQPTVAKPVAESHPKPKAEPQLDFAGKVRQVAQRIGADPVDLLTLMSFETAGTLSPGKRGPHVPGQGKAVGLIQFMPATSQELGTSVEALAAMSAIDQLDYVEKYLVKRGFRPGMGLKQLYSTVFAGHPHARGSIGDGYHTLDSAVARMNREHRPRAEAMLKGGKPSTFADTKAIIATWDKKWQEDAKVGDIIGGHPISSGRGWRVHPITQQRQFHDGVDLAAPIGTPLFAIADGTVKCFNDPHGGGIVARFTSPQFPNLEFELLHLSRCGAVGKVKAGDIIGYIGSTGNSTGPHLHLEIASTITNNSLRVRSGWVYWFVTGKKP